MTIRRAGPTSGRRRADIQWLRAIAAISVVIWHTDLIVKHVWDWELTRNAGYKLLGGFGVELFFMLSGYSICMQVERLKEPREFLLTRACRIYPLYWFFSVLMLLAFVVNPAWHLSARAEQGPIFILLSMLALPQEKMPLLPLGWTLELELVFYLMVAAAMVTGALKKTKEALGWLLVALGFAGFVAGVPPTGGMVLFDIVTPYMAAFGFGWLLRCRETRPGGSTLLLVGGAIASILCLSLVLLSERLIARSGWPSRRPRWSR